MCTIQRHTHDSYPDLNYPSIRQKYFSLIFCKKKAFPAILHHCHPLSTYPLHTSTLPRYTYTQHNTVDIFSLSLSLCVLSSFSFCAFASSPSPPSTSSSSMFRFHIVRFRMKARFSISRGRAVVATRPLSIHANNSQTCLIRWFCFPLCVSC